MGCGASSCGVKGPADTALVCCPVPNQAGRKRPPNQTCYSPSGRECLTASQLKAKGPSIQEVQERGEKLAGAALQDLYGGKRTPEHQLEWLPSPLVGAFASLQAHRALGEGLILPHYLDREPFTRFKDSSTQRAYADRSPLPLLMRGVPRPSQSYPSPLTDEECKRLVEHFAAQVYLRDYLKAVANAVLEPSNQSMSMLMPSYDHGLTALSQSHATYSSSLLGAFLRRAVEDLAEGNESAWRVSGRIEFAKPDNAIKERTSGNEEERGRAKDAAGGQKAKAESSTPSVVKFLYRDETWKWPEETGLMGTNDFFSVQVVHGNAFCFPKRVGLGFHRGFLPIRNHSVHNVYPPSPASSRRGSPRRVVVPSGEGGSSPSSPTVSAQLTAASRDESKTLALPGQVGRSVETLNGTGIGRSPQGKKNLSLPFSGGPDLEAAMRSPLSKSPQRTARETEFPSITVPPDNCHVPPPPAPVSSSSSSSVPFRPSLCQHLSAPDALGHLPGQFVLVSRSAAVGRGTKMGSPTSMEARTRQETPSRSISRAQPQSEHLQLEIEGEGFSPEVARNFARRIAFPLPPPGFQDVLTSACPTATLPFLPTLEQRRSEADNQDPPPPKFVCPLEADPLPLPLGAKDPSFSQRPFSSRAWATCDDFLSPENSTESPSSPSFSRGDTCTSSLGGDCAQACETGMPISVHFLQPWHLHAGLKKVEFEVAEIPSPTPFSSLNSLPPDGGGESRCVEGKVITEFGRENSGGGREKEGASGSAPSSSSSMVHYGVKTPLRPFAVFIPLSPLRRGKTYEVTFRLEMEETEEEALQEDRRKQEKEGEGGKADGEEGGEESKPRPTYGGLFAREVAAVTGWIRPSTEISSSSVLPSNLVMKWTFQTRKPNVWRVQTEETKLSRVSISSTLSSSETTAGDLRFSLGFAMRHLAPDGDVLVLGPGSHTGRGILERDTAVVGGGSERCSLLVGENSDFLRSCDENALSEESISSLTHLLGLRYLFVQRSVWSDFTLVCDSHQGIVIGSPQTPGSLVGGMPGPCLRLVRVRLVCTDCPFVLCQSASLELIKCDLSGLSPDQTLCRFRDASVTPEEGTERVKLCGCKFSRDKVPPKMGRNAQIQSEPQGNLGRSDAIDVQEQSGLAAGETPAMKMSLSIKGGAGWVAKVYDPDGVWIESDLTS
uniref:Uncharacterized protein n=1 Tax=Chromera velia CCMP2878 TaxID=1169474 RepID=A0A0G4GPA3_9ALVE|eukprot:Cvel_22778.t1-p1 / transcript=Cvel_22778.t1 / gene=Cvel_22778 / organism=Chromera_velia_CCMP2878 / gene_product=hypothetical protein / transcript_product=hypothetical protein / location=Cvel_scaffold2277:6472-11972(-) / protein_length=1173 / sequence_SO=supercontig / SO=protein_coding / is_pseudo=false